MKPGDLRITSAFHEVWSFKTSELSSTEFACVSGAIILLEFIPWRPIRNVVVPSVWKVLTSMGIMYMSISELESRTAKT